MVWLLQANNTLLIAAGSDKLSSAVLLSHQLIILISGAHAVDRYGVFMFFTSSTFFIIFNQLIFHFSLWQRLIWPAAFSLSKLCWGITHTYGSSSSSTGIASKLTMVVIICCGVDIKRHFRGSWTIVSSLTEIDSPDVLAVAITLDDTGRFALSKIWWMMLT